MSQEKKFTASHRKQQKARREGHVAKSAELTGSVVVLSGVICIATTYLDDAVRMNELFRCAYLEISAGDLKRVFPELIAFACSALMTILSLVLGVSCIMGFVVELAQVGFSVQFSSLCFNWTRLNPFSGIARIWGSSEGIAPIGLFYQLFRRLILLLMISLLSLALIIPRFGALIEPDVSDRLPLDSAISITLLLCESITGVYLIAGIIDYFFLRRRHALNLRMTAQELKEEIRSSEGDPQMRCMRRARYQELVLSSIADSVRRSSVIVVGTIAR